MGKYSNLRGRIPAFEEEPSRRELLDAFKNAFLEDAVNPEDINVAFLARAYADRQVEKQNIAKRECELNIELDALSELIVKTLDEEGTEKLELVGGGSISSQTLPYPSVVDEEKFEEWGKKEFGAKAWLAMKIKPRLHQNRFQALAGDRALNGLPDAPGTKTFTKTKAKVSLP